MKRLAVLLMIALFSSTFAQVAIDLWVRENATGAALEETIIPAFEAANPDITVNITKFAGQSLEEAMDIAFATGQMPDVVIPSGIERRGPLGFFRDLQGIVDQDVIESFRPFMTPGVQVQGGSVYALPLDIFTNRLIYNPELFEAAGLDPDSPPRTFSEVIEAARAITENTDAFGYGAPIGWLAFYDFQVDPLVIASEPTLTRQGLFNAATGQFETWRYGPVIEMLRTMAQEELLFPGASSLDNDPMRAAFAAGEIGMYIATSWDVNTLDNLGADFEWRTSHVPVEDGRELLLSISLVGGGYAVSAASQHPEEAGRLVQYLASVEGVRPLVDLGLIRPTLLELADIVNEDVYGFELFAPTELDGAFLIEPTRSIEVQGRSYVDVLNELILRPGNVNIEAALRELAERYQRAYEQAIAEGRIERATFEIQ
jgi:multiple sugar transport system substrate-binding protein